MVWQIVALASSLLIAQPEAPAPPPPDPAALAAVRGWLAALGAKDPAKLRAASTVPFTYVTDAKRKRCDGVATDEKAVAKTLKCVVRTEKLLIEELRYPDEVVLQGAEPNGFPPVTYNASSSRKLIDKLGTVEGQTTIEGFINGDGVTFDFVFAVRPDGKGVKVSGLILHSEIVE